MLAKQKCALVWPVHKRCLYKATFHREFGSAHQEWRGPRETCPFYWTKITTFMVKRPGDAFPGSCEFNVQLAIHGARILRRHHSARLCCWRTVTLASTSGVRKWAWARKHADNLFLLYIGVIRPSCRMSASKKNQNPSKTLLYKILQKCAWCASLDSLRMTTMFIEATCDWQL